MSENKLTLAFDFGEDERRLLHALYPHPTDADGMASETSLRETVGEIIDRAWEHFEKDAEWREADKADAEAKAKGTCD